MVEFSYRPATLEALRWLSLNLRNDDRLEIEFAAPGISYQAVLMYQVESDPTALVGYYGDEPVALFGCGGGRPWMLGSVKLNAIPFAMARETFRTLSAWLDEHGTLSNRICVHATENIRWLERLGFEFSYSQDPDYLKFSKERSHVSV